MAQPAVELQPKIPFTFVPPEKTLRLERRITLAVTVIPLIGFVLAVVTMWGRGITALDLALFFGFYAISGLGVTVGFHRMLTHRSFEAGPVLKVILSVAGSLAVQGAVISWVSDHRRHHAFADREGDPHSPHLAEAVGVKGVLSGLWHAHVGWFFDADTTSVSHFAPDMARDRSMVIVSKLFPLWVVVTFALPGAIGLAVTHTLAGAWSAVLWGGLARVFFLHHVTWSINSICHFYGKRPFESRDKSTNNWPLCLLSFGEAWHNNHHAFPSSAKHGLEPWQVDLSALIISGFAKVGLARNVKVPSRDDLETKRRIA